MVSQCCRKRIMATIALPLAFRGKSGVLKHKAADCVFFAEYLPSQASGAFVVWARQSAALVQLHGYRRIPDFWPQKLLHTFRRPIWLIDAHNSLLPFTFAQYSSEPHH